MTLRHLPDHPDLDWYRKQAKELLAKCKRGDVSAAERVRRTHPHPSAAVLTLADAQLVIAREHGIDSWPKFVKAVEAASGRLSARSAWRSAERAVADGDVPTLEQLLSEYGDVLRNWRPRQWWRNPVPPSYSVGDARQIIVAFHRFRSWSEYDAFVTERAVPGTWVTLFEEAADAVVLGQIGRLRELLDRNPELIRARALRHHHATLLHYLGATGVESFREKSPPNSTEVLELLLARGADVNAMADIGDGSTALALVAMNRHAWTPGLLERQIDLLIAGGARLDVPANVASGIPLVNACLSFARPGIAAHLADRGAPLDAEAAAGLGRMDILAACFAADGTLKPPLTMAGMEAALVSGTAHPSAVAFLLDRGVSADGRAHGMPAIYAAAVNAHLDSLRLLIARGASLEESSTYQGTALRGALMGAAAPHDPDWHLAPADYVPIVDTLIDAGASVDSSLVRWWDERSLASGEEDAVSAEIHREVAALLRGAVP